MLSIALCDDDVHFMDLIVQLMKKELTLLNIPFHIVTFNSGESLLYSYQKEGALFDMIFLDIDMQPLDGLETASRLRQLDTKVMLIFLTSMADKVYDAFGYNAFKFIRKDYSSELFIKNLKDCIQHIHLLTQGFVFETTEGIVRITEQSILFFEIKARKFYMQTPTLKYRLLVDNFEQILRIIQCHPFFAMPNRSTLLNLRYVKNITKQNLISIEHNGICYTLELSRYKKQDFYNAFINHIKQ